MGKKHLSFLQWFIHEAELSLDTNLMYLVFISLSTRAVLGHKSHVFGFYIIMHGSCVCAVLSSLPVCHNHLWFPFYPRAQWVLWEVLAMFLLVTFVMCPLLVRNSVLINITWFFVYSLSKIHGASPFPMWFCDHSLHSGCFRCLGTHLSSVQHLLLELQLSIFQDYSPNTWNLFEKRPTQTFWQMKDPYFNFFILNICGVIISQYTDKWQRPLD